MSLMKIFLIILAVFTISSYETNSLDSDENSDLTRTLIVVEFEAFGSTLFNVTMSDLIDFEVFSDMIKRKIFVVRRIMRYTFFDKEKVEKWIKKSYRSEIRAG